MSEEEKHAGLVQSDKPALSAEFTLAYPKEHEGQTYSTVTIRRVTVKQMADFIKEMQAGNDVAPPMIDLPVEVYLKLDDDDMLEIEEKMRPFIPRRLQNMLGSLPDAGGDTSA